MQRPPTARLTLLLAMLGLSLVAWRYREPIRDRLRHEPVPIQELPGHDAPELPELPTLDGHAVSLEALRGRVVLLHFWTFSCSNCEHMMPHYLAWDRRFRAAGLSVIGVHSPETALEQDQRQLAQYVAREGITWPVLIDRDFQAWRRFGVHAWPTIVLIDRQGRVRAVHLGDRLADTIEHEIQSLLAG